MKLLWDGKCNRFNKVERFVLRLCIYGINKQFIKDCLGRRTTRTEASNNSIAKYINHVNDKSNCIISNEYKIEMQRKEKILA